MNFLTFTKLFASTIILSGFTTTGISSESSEIVENRKLNTRDFQLNCTVPDENQCLFSQENSTLLDEMCVTELDISVKDGEESVVVKMHVSYDRGIDAQYYYHAIKDIFEVVRGNEIVSIIASNEVIWAQQGPIVGEDSLYLKKDEDGIFKGYLILNEDFAFEGLICSEKTSRSINGTGAILEGIANY